MKTQDALKLYIRKKAPVFFQKLRFFKKSHYWPSTQKPRTINEILFLLKISSKKEDRIYVDKIASHKTVSSIITKEGLDELKLPKLLLKSENPEYFFENIPNIPCFIKSNHGSGMAKFYDPKLGLTENKKKEITDWLKLDYSLNSGEKCYEGITPLLLAEEAIFCKDGTLPNDIKVHCYCGVPFAIQILRRTTGELERKTFDASWHEKEWFKNEVLHTDTSKIPKEKILSYARALSKNIKYVRVDFYHVDDSIYFSELTLYPNSGNLQLKDKKIDHLLGKKLLQIETEQSL